MKKVLALLVVILAAVVPLARAAATTKPSVVSFKVTPTTLMATGGAVTIFASVRHATHCTFTVTPAVKGLPATVACSSDKASKKVSLPKNISTAAKTYAFSFKATGPGGSATATPLTVKVLAAPFITSFLSAPRNFTPVGGIVTLTATVKNAKSCSFTVAPSVKGLPATVSCSSGRAVEKVTLPANPTASRVTYAFSLKATGPGGSITAKPQHAAVLPFWSAPQAIDPTVSLIDSVSCSTDFFCEAVDNSGDVLTWNGKSWSTPRTIDGAAGQELSGLLAVSCALRTTSFCAAGDGFGNILTWNGKSWSAPKNISEAAISSVSCPSSSFCVAATSDGNILTWNGKSWSGARSIDPHGGGLTSVSCPTSSYCAAVDSNFSVVTWNGKTWSAPRSIDRGGLVSVSCPTTTYCVALDDRGSAETWNGKSWSAARSIDVNGGDQSVSCAATSYCAVVDWSSVVTWNGRSWAAPVPIDPNGFDTDGLDSVSCATSSFCAAVGLDGNAIIGKS